MVTPLLLAVLLQQGPTLAVSAAVDPGRVTVGGDIVFTVTATSAASAPVDLDPPALDGFAVLVRRERSEVGFTFSSPNRGVRTTVWEYHLRALAAGHFSLGPVRVRQGGRSAQAAAVGVDVAATGAAVAAGLNPRVQSLLEHAPPPPDTGVAVTVLTSAGTVLVGQQLDVVTAAWFPRDLRMRLRHPPTLEPPEFEGVWSYPQVAPTGIAATRQVRGTWYDLFILHQVVFPLTPGQIRMSPATLRYGVPVAFQFFSQEDHYALESAVPKVVALALPDSGRPPGFGGAAGSGLTLTRELGGAPRAGEPLEVTFTLSGEGNVSLWPAPFVRWPAGTPVYSSGVDEKIEPADGRIGGAKAYRYLIVPDSSGTLVLPSVDYAYYDLTAGLYRSASVSGIRLPVTAGGEAVKARAAPPPLELDSRPTSTWRLMHDLPAWGWAAVIAILPIAWLWRRRPRRRRRMVSSGPRKSLFGRAADELEATLRAVAGYDALADAERLRARLHAAGVEERLARRAADAWGRVRALRFAPGEARDAAAVAEEARAVARSLTPRVRRGRVLGACIALAALASAGRGAAQAPPAEQLYEAGALHAAADGFLARARSNPAVAAHWFNLGAAYYRLGEDGDALAAWARAARLDPRSVSVARARILVPAPDPVSDDWLRPVPITVEEIAAVALALWIVGWLGLVFGLPGRGRWWMLIVAGAAAGAGAWGLRRAHARPLAVIRLEGPARLSPYGSAPGSRSLPIGTAVRPERRRGGWVMVRAATGEEGWMPTEALAPVVDF